jgi:hypothetical protein
MTVIDARQELRGCQGPDCKQVLRRRDRETPRDFAARRFCSKQCSGAARRRVRPDPVSSRAKRSSLNIDPPPTPLRVTASGLWRPNAPGWPDEPGARA